MMAKKSEPGLIVGLDVGTSKIEAIVGELTDEGEIEIIGIGSSPSRGLKKGVVVNIESTVQSIQRAVEEAELMAGCEIHSVYTGIAGSHIKSYNSTGVVAIKDGEVVAGDVDRVIDAARAIAIPADQRILHVLPQEYIIDEQEGIREPIGMSGVRLEAKVHLVTGAVSAAQNIVKCVERCGLRVDDIILSSWPPATRCSARTKRIGGVPRRRGRRDHRHRRLCPRRDYAHGGHPDRWRSGDQRHRGRPAHADPVRRRTQDQVRLRAAHAGRPG